MNEPLEGGFFGIGIQFTILRDTLAVVAIVPGGPSEKAGLMAETGSFPWTERISPGKQLSNTEVRKRLKGEEGTIVKVGVLRGHENMDFRIIRGKIPIYSIDATYMLDKTTGYIKLSRFAATTIDRIRGSCQKIAGSGDERFDTGLADEWRGIYGSRYTVSPITCWMDGR